MATMHSHSEETFIFQAGVLGPVGGWRQSHVVRVAVEWAIVHQRDVAECVPSHEMLRKLERAVFYHLSVETAVGCEIYVLEEYAIHRGRDLNSGTGGIYYEVVFSANVGPW